MSTDPDNTSPIGLSGSCLRPQISTRTQKWSSKMALSDTMPTIVTMTPEALANAVFHVRSTIHDGNPVDLPKLSLAGQQACVQDAFGLIGLAAAWQQYYSRKNRAMSDELDLALREMFARLDVLCGIYTVQVDDDPDVWDAFPAVLERAMFGIAGALGTTPDDLAKKLQRRIDQLANEPVPTA